MHDSDRHVRSRFLISALIALTLASGFALAQTEITLGRFFGACEQAGTDIDAAVGEACIIQTIINAFSAEDNDIVVETLPTNWGNYYDQIIAAYSGGNPPNVHVMHKHRIPEFAGLGALAPLSEEDLMEAGIDPSDWTDGALDAVTFDGTIYGVPMDMHANLWHVNVDMLAEAGLINEDGTPMVPSSPEELLDHAQRVMEATGKEYLAADFAEFPIGVRLVLSLVWQQGADLLTREEAFVDTTEAQQAVELIVSMFDAGYANPELNYADSQQQFLNGDAAVLVNGTWVVDFYDAQAADAGVPLTNYYASEFPTIFGEAATWADSHLWVIPSPLAASDDAKFQAALQLLAWIDDHNLAWARTGHVAVRESVLASDAYQSLPHRDEYADTVNIARDVTATAKYSAIQDVFNRELQAIWLTGKPIEDALSDADDAIQDLLDR